MQPAKTEEERKERRKMALKRYAEKHPERIKESQKKYKEAHPEKRKATVKKWADANKERTHQNYIDRYYSNLEESRKRHAINSQNRRARVRNANGVLSKEIYQKLFALQKGKCACCRIDLTKIKAHIDHIQPLALGGENSDNNVQLLCQPCNNQKSWRHPVDFMQSKGFLL